MKKDGLHIDSKGNKHWYLNGNHHRVDGPAIEFVNGNKQWWINGVEYEEEAFNSHPLFYEDDEGSKYWYLATQFHRTDGRELADGTKAWYINGKFHRIDGPALISKQGSKKINQWWIDGESYSKKEFNNHPLVVALKEKQPFEKIINEKKLSRKVKL